MILKHFYAKDENIISAVYNSDVGKAEIVVDPFLHHEVSQSLFTSVKLPCYKIMCSQFEFDVAFKSLEEHIQKS